MRRSAGSLLITFSLLLLAYIYYPILKLYLPGRSVLSQEEIMEGYYLTIPKIRAQAPIITDADPWAPAQYLPILEKGIAQVKNTALPGEPGTIFLFAHSSVAPWKITRTNTSFLRLGELKINDEIIVTKDGTEYHYLVSDIKDVWPAEVSYLKSAINIDLGDKLQVSEFTRGKNALILQTCTPLGTSLKRLLIFARSN